MAPSPAIRLRIAAAGVGLAVAALGGEFAWRALGPRALAQAEIRDASGRAVPLAEVAAFLGRKDTSLRAPSPSSVIAPGIDIAFCYDGPRPVGGDERGCIAVRTNSRGFRDGEFALPKPVGETRVLALGDSFTFGNGVAVEDTWVQQLEGLLAAELGAVEVVNGGFATGDHQPGGYVAWLASDGLALDPDLVVVGLCLNDLGDVPMALVPPAVAEPWLGGASTLLVHLQQMRADRAFERAALPDARLLLEIAPEPWLATQRGLVGLRDLCNERGVAFAVAVFPMLERLEPGRYPFQGLHDAVAEFAARESIALVDTLPAFMGRDAHALWAHPTDQHPSPQGHALIAGALRGPLLGLLLERRAR
jgi:lysophospholipase L1-like esterase